VVLFACVHNAGRSQMAAGWLRHLAGERITVVSGGAQPADTVNAAAVQAMAEIGIDIAGQQPRAWTDLDIADADVVITMGCGDRCPVVPGTRYQDWPLNDPAGQPLETVRLIRDDIGERVRALVSELTSGPG